jgi:ribosomal protein S18 acetylase RimI-like enzyme
MTAAARYQFEERPPTTGEYLALCAAVGWEPFMNADAVPASLAGSLYHVVVVHAGQVVGMGRVVGDGAIYFYIQDIAVHPDHRRRGLGGAIMDHVIAYLRRQAPPRAFVGLFATTGTEAFYRRYGFQGGPALTGVFLVMPDAR